MELFDHQRKIIEEDPKITGLWLGTGSGKTRIALMLARDRVLVICPKTQKEDGNWEREFKNVFQYDAESGGRYDILRSRIGSLTVISKETFRRDHTSLPEFDTVIVDEAHTCLGVTPNTRMCKRVEVPKASQLFEALDEYLQRTKPTRLYLCTATIIKSPMTVWAAQKLLLNRNAFNMEHFFLFRSTFYTKLPMPPGRQVYVPKSDSATKDKLATIVRGIGYTGRLEDYFDVPEQTYKVDYVELTAAQKARIKDMSLEYAEPIVRVGKKHQIENGVLSSDGFSELEVFDNAKIARILDYVLEFPRMVIFAKYRAQIDQITNAVARAGYNTLQLTGDTVDRGAVIAEANRRETNIFVCQAQISAGWELPEYPVMIFASSSYSFVDRVQAEGRILRANHLKKNLYLDIVVKGGVDEAIHNSLTSKKDFDERIYANRDL